MGASGMGKGRRAYRAIQARVIMEIYQFPHEVRIYNLGDIHRGNKTCNTSRLYKTIAAIKDDPHARWISTGDILETATNNSKSDSYSAMSPDEELTAIAEEFAPIASKCLGFVASNHHHRIEREVGLSLDTVLAEKLSIPFLGKSARIVVVCGRCAYFINLHHGVGGGTDGNKLNRAITLAQNWLGLDIYMTGHTHTYDHCPIIQTVIDRKRRKMTEIKSHIVITGHYLGYEGSYAEDMGLKAKPIGSAVVELGYNDVGVEANKKIRAWLSE